MLSDMPNTQASYCMMLLDLLASREVSLVTKVLKNVGGGAVSVEKPEQDE